MNIFRHGIASGDPLQDRVILWTRITAADHADIEVKWEVAEEDGFHDLICEGTSMAVAENDYCVHVDPDGLQPGCRYYYRFHALGETSPTGRTQTLPPQDTNHVRFVQTSCAKFNAGYFNAYARMADHDDIDFVLHLGDYIYEASNTPPAGQTPGADIGRPFEPLYECKTLADYRMRYNQYRRDPDVQKMHSLLPIIPIVDDHEFADGAWRGGADVHDEAKDGPWTARLASCFRARWEWLPIRPPDPADPGRVYRKVQFGGLADLILINTRTHRDQPVPPPDMYSESRTTLGPDQREWLFHEFEHSSAKWRLLGNSSIISTTWREDLPEECRLALLKTKLIAADAQGSDYDQWDGYPFERKLLLDLMRKHPLGNNIVLSGDIHVCMVIELKENPFAPVDQPVGIEFINTSLTSQNLDDKMKWGYRTRSLTHENAITRAFPHILWCDLDSHGYNIVDVTPDRVQVEYWLVDTVLERTEKERLDAVWRVNSGKPHVVRIL